MLETCARPFAGSGPPASRRSSSWPSASRTGATTFSVVRGLLLRRLPYRDSRACGSGNLSGRGAAEHARRWPASPQPSSKATSSPAQRSFPPGVPPVVERQRCAG